MSDLNQCQFIGRLGRDPETRYNQNGDPVTSISIACGWKGKDNEGVEWVPVVFFGRLAEVAGEYLRKGSQVYVSGRYNTQTWEKDGVKQYRTQVVATQMQMLGSKDKQEPSNTTNKQSPSFPPDDDFNDTIPF